MKKTLRILLLGLFAASSMSLTSCKDDLIDIGILQVMTHDALNGARDGFIEQLKEEGFVEGENIRISKNAAEGDTATENSMATKLATSSDLVFGISTSSALALKALSVTRKKKLLFFIRLSLTPSEPV
ncbi:MAG: ABC transporter substrate binding protein [Bacilli bacterium]